jgi:hypothetical protein
VTGQPKRSWLLWRAADRSGCCPKLEWGAKVFDPITAEPGALVSAPSRFALYVEGPRDRDILRLFARKLSPRLARTMDPCVKILGGRRPRRAAELFRLFSAQAEPEQPIAPRGLCVLDSDKGDASHDVFPDEPRLDYFVWSRRHIESYLLVPDAIRECLRSPRLDASIDSLLSHHIPDPSDEAQLRDLDAKRLLGKPGPIARVLGRPLLPREIVRSMSPVDIHSDVRELLMRVSTNLKGEPGGGSEAGPAARASAGPV